jgi:hypothetical protein
VRCGAAGWGIAVGCGAVGCGVCMHSTQHSHNHSHIAERLCTAWSMEAGVSVELTRDAVARLLTDVAALLVVDGCCLLDVCNERVERDPVVEAYRAAPAAKNAADEKGRMACYEDRREDLRISTTTVPMIGVTVCGVSLVKQRSYISRVLMAAREIMS